MADLASPLALVGVMLGLCGRPHLVAVQQPAVWPPAAAAGVHPGGEGEGQNEGTGATAGAKKTRPAKGERRAAAETEKPARAVPQQPAARQEAKGQAAREAQQATAVLQETSGGQGQRKPQTAAAQGGEAAQAVASGETAGEAAASESGATAPQATGGPQGQPAGGEAGAEAGAAEGGQQPGEGQEPGAGQAEGGQLSEDKARVRADKLFYTEDRLQAEGNVTVETTDFTITADRVEVDRRADTAIFQGNVVLRGQNYTVTGSRLWIDLDSGAWRMERPRAKVEPEFFAAGQVLEPLYAWGLSAEYDPERDCIVVRNAYLSSCDKPRPHWFVRSRLVRLRPEQWLVARRPQLYMYGSRVAIYPFDLHLSLRETRQRIFPEFGENDVEGQYLKLAFLYLMGAHNSGLARLHITEKRGIGFGFDHSLVDSRQTLDVSFFDEPSQGALSLRGRHEYRFSSTLTSSFMGSFQDNSGYLYATRSLNADWTLRNFDANSDTVLAWHESLTRTGTMTSRYWGSNVRHSQRMGRRSRWDINATFRHSDFSGLAAADEELTGEFNYRHTAPRYDLEVEASNRWDPDGAAYTGDSNYFALNRLPHIVISTDSRRLGRRLFGRIYTRANFQLGHYVQDPDNISVWRAAFQGYFGGHSHPLGSRTRVRRGLRFRQSFYSDGSAQYNLGFNSELRHDFGGNLAARLTYMYSTTRGYAPIRLDFSGRSNLAMLQLVRLVPDRSRFEVATGYDFISSRWYDLRLLAEMRLSDHLYWRAQTAYSIERGEWWPLVVRWTMAYPDKLYLDLAASYDLARGDFNTITADTDFRIGRLWRVEFVGSYSGFTGQIDQANVRITRDLHCMIAQLVYSKWPRELYFAIGFKAFPAEERPLGIGRTGAWMPGYPAPLY